MTKWIKRLVVLGQNAKDRSPLRRRSKVTKPGCDSLEGRQLLSMFGGPRGVGIVGPQQAHVGHVQTFSALGGRRGVAGNSVGIARGGASGLRGHGRHVTMSGRGQTGMPGASSTAPVPGAASPTAITPTAPPASLSSAGAMTPNALPSSPTGIGAQAPTTDLSSGLPRGRKQDSRSPSRVRVWPAGSAGSAYPAHSIEHKDPAAGDRPAQARRTLRAPRFRKTSRSSIAISRRFRKNRL